MTIDRKMKIQNLLGSKFKEQFNNATFYKVTNDREIHHGLRYKDGLNVDTVKTSRDKHTPSGIQFVNEDVVHRYFDRGVYIRKVTILDDSLVTQTGIFRYRTNKLELHPRRKLAYDDYLLSVKKDGFFLQKIPKEYRTEEMINVALRQQIELHKSNEKSCEFDANNLNEMYKLAIEHNVRNVCLIPRKGITKELALMVIKKTYKYTHYIPEEVFTPEICNIAVNHSWLAIRDIPDKFKTEELYALALERFLEKYNVKKYMPNDIKEVYHKIIQYNDYVIEIIPEKYRTRELCLKALETNAHTLRYMSDDTKTEELCRNALTKCPCILRFVPDNMKKKLYQKAVGCFGKALKFIPEGDRTEELCKIALRNNPIALEFVPNHLKTKELCMNVVKENKEMLYYVPDNLLDEMSLI